MSTFWLGEMKKIADNSKQSLPPPFEHIVIYFDQKHCTEAEARKFYEHHQIKGWTTPTGAVIKNWKTAVRDWIWQLLEKSAYRRSKART